jgi:hypothetical protein
MQLYILDIDGPGHTLSRDLKTINGSSAECITNAFNDDLKACDQELQEISRDLSA